MADQNSSDLSTQVQTLILLSFGLDPKQKEELLEQLPKLTLEQLRRLADILDEEQTMKQKMLSDFFTDHPQLFPNFERATRQQVNSVYHEVETEDHQEDENKIQELLHTPYS